MALCSLPMMTALYRVGDQASARLVQVSAGRVTLVRRLCKQLAVPTCSVMPVAKGLLRYTWSLLFPRQLWLDIVVVSGC
jgi:hypothetical protein